MSVMASKPLGEAEDCGHIRHVVHELSVRSAHHVREVWRPVAELDAQGGQNRHDGGVMPAVDVERR